VLVVTAVVVIIAVFYHDFPYNADSLLSSIVASHLAPWHNVLAIHLQVVTWY
jgi:hypothetical protein